MCGFRDHRIQKLLWMQGLELTTAVGKARAMEAVTKETHNFIEDGKNMELHNTATHFVRKVAPRQSYCCESATHHQQPPGAVTRTNDVTNATELDTSLE